MLPTSFYDKEVQCHDNVELESDNSDEEIILLIRKPINLINACSMKNV